MMRFIVALYVLAFSCIASAEVPEERDLTSDPMPHLIYNASQKQINVHFARLKGYFIADDGGSWLNELKRGVEECLRSRNGDATSPVAFPDHYAVDRQETYIATNRTIVYNKAYFFTVDVKTCKISTTPEHQASLLSTLGECKIDLVRKTARGVCDASGHAGAKPMHVKGEISGSNGKLPRKIILGIECEVHTVKPAGQVCSSIGGSFQWGGPPNPRMALENINAFHHNAQAVEAKLDTLVSESVFTPYLSGGFDIKYYKTN